MVSSKTSIFAVALTMFTSQVLACVDFGVTINSYGYASGNLRDNGERICTVSTYGDNNGWPMNCNGGYSGYIRYNDKVVEYNTPHGAYTFATNCTPQNTGTPGGSFETCTASPFC